MNTIFGPYKTLVLEDTNFDYQAIENILRGLPQIQIVGRATTITEAFDMCERLKPDLIIADAKIGHDKMAGAAFVKSIRKIMPQVRILGLTYHPDLVDGLRRAGCHAVANKALMDDDEAARRYLVETLIPRPEFYRDFKPPSLTPQQDRVLKDICEGLTEDEIAVRLGHESRKPVRNIKNQLFDIFGARSAANLVYLAFKSGYLNPDQD